MFNFKRSLIALFGVLVLVGALATMMPLVSRGQGGNPFDRDPRKAYYLTQTTHNGGQARSACAAGYHMASLWEILDTFEPEVQHRPRWDSRTIQGSARLATLPAGFELELWLPSPSILVLVTATLG